MQSIDPRRSGFLSRYSRGWRLRACLLLLACGVLRGSALGLQATATPVPARVFNDPSALAPPGNTAKTAPASAAALVGSHPATPGTLQVIPLGSPHPAAALKDRKLSATVKVTGADWVDSNLLLASGDHVVFTTKGTVTLADGRKVTAEGVTKGWKDLLRQFPDPNGNAGALIGRIGSSPAAVPFPLGATTTMDLTVGGDLFLRINASTDLTPTNSYSVEVKITAAPAAKAASVSSAAARALTSTPSAGTTPGSAPSADLSQNESAPDLATLLNPALFANVPRRVEDEAHNPGDMVNFALIGTEAQVQDAFKAAGWIAVDKTNQEAILHGLLATLQHQQYTAVPISTLYLFGRPQDLSYERAEPIAVAAVRHHLRVWKTDETVAGRPLWVGSATHDNGFEKDQRNGGITHHIDPNIDEERDFIQQSFAAAGVLAGAAYITPQNPLRTAITATGGSFQSDGRIVVLDLR